MDYEALMRLARKNEEKKLKEVGSLKLSDKGTSKHDVHGKKPLEYSKKYSDTGSRSHDRETDKGKDRDDKGSRHSNREDKPYDRDRDRNVHSPIIKDSDKYRTNERAKDSHGSDKDKYRANERAKDSHGLDKDKYRANERAKDSHGSDKDKYRTNERAKDSYESRHSTGHSSKDNDKIRDRTKEKERSDDKVRPDNRDEIRKKFEDSNRNKNTNLDPLAFKHASRGTDRERPNERERRSVDGDRNKTTVRERGRDQDKDRSRERMASKDVMPVKRHSDHIPSSSTVKSGSSHRPTSSTNHRPVNRDSVPSKSSPPKSRLSTSRDTSRDSHIHSHERHKSSGTPSRDQRPLPTDRKDIRSTNARPVDKTKSQLGSLNQNKPLRSEEKPRAKANTMLSYEELMRKASQKSSSTPSKPISSSHSNIDINDKRKGPMKERSSHDVKRARTDITPKGSDQKQTKSSDKDRSSKTSKPAPTYTTAEQRRMAVEDIKKERERRRLERLGIIHKNRPDMIKAHTAERPLTS
eukprot:Ihof_evm3s313 gene=Ihof_evmTU3s313